MACSKCNVLCKNKINKIDDILMQSGVDNLSARSFAFYCKEKDQISFDDFKLFNISFDQESLDKINEILGGDFKCG